MRPGDDKTDESAPVSQPHTPRWRKAVVGVIGVVVVLALVLDALAAAGVFGPLGD
jgi:hypothetical protein